MRTFATFALCAALAISGGVLLWSRVGHEAPLQAFYGRHR